jgi:hypothetical protein
MQRNPDLLRDILIAAEKQPAGHKLYGSGLKQLCNDIHELADHVQQLIEGGYLEGTVRFSSSDTPPKVIIHRVKSAGHDFLQAMSDDTIWKKVKENIMRPAIGWTLGIAVAYAEQQIRERLGLK